MDKTLKTLQLDFYQDVLNPDKAQDYLGNDDFSGSDLIKIYHNQYFINLKQTLGYSCVKRLVGEDFFNMLAKFFIETHPSKTGSIIDYGHDFPRFISNNERCKVVLYLADIAKFERLYERCYFSLDGAFYAFTVSNYQDLAVG